MAKRVTVIRMFHNPSARTAEVVTKSPAQAMRVLRMLVRLNGPWVAYGDCTRRVEETV